MSKIENVKQSVNPLVVFASVLSAASIIWTTYSIADLFRLHSANPSARLTDMSAGAGWIGFTVAAGADIVWGGIIYAQYKGKPYKVSLGKDKKKVDLVPILGWLAVLAVVILIAWHGRAQQNLPMMVGGPFLPLGAKVMWMLALNALKDDSALTEDQLIEIHEVMRDSSYAAQITEAESKLAKAEHERELEEMKRKHEKDMARLNFEAEKDRESDRLRAERVLARDDNFFAIRRMRAEKAMEMEIESPVIAGELAAPEDTSLREPIGRIPSGLDTTQRKVVTLPIDRINGLSERDNRLRTLAAAWYHVESIQPGMTQRDFCNQVEIEGRRVTPPDLSKAKAKFSIHDFTDDELEFAYKKAVGA